MCLLLVTIGIPVAPADAATDGGLHARVRRTAHGIVHVDANDYAGLGYGYGYAFAQDNLCIAAEEFVTVDARRARYFGTAPDVPAGMYRNPANGVVTTNLASDVFWQWLNDSRTVERLVAQPPPTGPTAEVRELVRGYATGWNRYLRDTGAATIPDPGCRGAAWVRPITEMDVYRRLYQFTVFSATDAMQAGIVSAEPPRAQTAPAVAEPVAELTPALGGTGRWEEGALGSNVIAVGAEASADGGSMLLANPHFPWLGSDESRGSPLRFHQLHYTIPGRLDVAGVALSGMPFVVIGHNTRLAWSHTVDRATHFTFVEVKLVAGDSTAYEVDGRVEKMQAHIVAVPVANPDGSFDIQSDTVYMTRFGPVVESADTPWSATYAYALADPNADNFRLANEWLAMARATDVSELERIQDRFVGVPFFNTVAADATGRVYYADHAVVPHVTDGLRARCAVSVQANVLWARARVLVLDGSRSACGWGADDDAPVGGIFGPSRLPKLFRNDYVRNSNDSHWLANPRHPLTGYEETVFGPTPTPLSLRARLGIKMLEELLLSEDARAGGIAADQLQDITLNNRNHAGELVRDDLIAFCRTHSVVTTAQGPVDVSEACAVLERWDLKADLDSVGEILFRQFWVGESDEPGKLTGASFAEAWKNPFHSAEPLNTPNTLDTSDPRVQQALGDAVRRLRAAGLPLDARLRDYQLRAEAAVAVHGGSHWEGIFNQMRTWFRPPKGYIVGHGSSFIMVVTLAGRCPDARSILTYSQSSNPTSPYFTDQTDMFSRKEWVHAPFCEDQITNDQGLFVTEISERSTNQGTGTASRGR